MRLRDLPRNAFITGGNLLRSLRRKGLECVILSIHGSYPERTPQRDPLPFPFNRLPVFPAEPSLEGIQAIVERIGADRRVQNVVLRLDTLRANPSALYSLRRMLADLRAQGKHLVAWLPGAETWDYYLASACDEVILPPSGRLSVLGLRSEAVFLKDALASIGVEADLEAIAEYKVSPDTFRRSAMSEPHREMLNALLDAYFDEIVSALARGRDLPPAQVRDLIDRTPLTPTAAAKAGLIDAALYEDELASHLIAPSQGEVGALCTWREAARWLRRPLKRTTRQTIGVVSLEGMIVPGRSRRIPAPIPLPFVESQAGAETVVQALRQAEADKHMAAVIFHVETPGGSALASDLICREVRLLRERKPVVVLMGAQATSGGYYVSALANRIVACPTTLTGSIGIRGGKFTLKGLYERLGIGREKVQRGTMADLYSEMAPFSAEERAWVRRDLGESYALFKSLVAEGRGMAEEQVEEIARGRVWTGIQAHEIGLVDELGDFQTAMALAKELAGLDPEREYTVMAVQPPRHALPPQPFPAAPQQLAQGIVDQTWLLLVESLNTLARERIWALAPWVVQIK